MIIKNDYDIISYLDDKLIDYKRGGEKNITRGWIGISCPFNDCDDPSYHCGISPQNFFYCWRCGRKGHATKLISVIENVSYEEAKKILSAYKDDSYIELKDFNTADQVKLPGDIYFPQIHRDYLNQRNFRVQEVIDQFKLRACYNVGKWKFRIIIPVFFNNKLVTFTSRSIFDIDPKYKNCPNNESVMPIKNCVYNIDTVKDKALIVEGPLDVFRFGNKCIAFFGMEYSSKQINQIKNKNLKKAFIMLDSGENEQAKADKLANILKLFIKEIKIINLEKNDPADLTYEEANKIKKEILL